MRSINTVSINQPSPWRRFLLTLQLDPTKALIFYGIVGVLLFTGIFGAFYGGITGQMNARAADLQNAPVQTVTAVVQNKTPWDRSTKLNPANSGVTLDVQVDGRQTSTPAVIDERTFAVRVGDRIQVKYRIGKSGATYIEEWQPLPR